MTNLNLDFDKQELKKYVVNVKRLNVYDTVEQANLLNINEQQLKLLDRLCVLYDVFDTEMDRPCITYQLVETRENIQDENNTNAERKIAGLFDKEVDAFYMWNLTQDQIDLLQWLACEDYIPVDVVGVGVNNVNPDEL